MSDYIVCPKCSGNFNVKSFSCCHCGYEPLAAEVLMRQSIHERDEEIASLKKFLDAMKALLLENDYDAGLLNDFGGGNVNWWRDYIRNEVERCNNYWRSRIDDALAGGEASQ